jgi:ATP-dependent helicase HepA
MTSDLFSMIGYLVVHTEFGPGKIVGSEGRNIKVYIAANERQMTFGKAAIDQGSFTRSTLYPGALVKSKQGTCKITKVLNPRSESAFEYNVVYEDTGLTTRITELDLFPLSSDKTDTLIGRLLQGRPSEFKQFASRENLLISTSRLKRQVGGLQALLSSRIEVFPHQAFVTGLVIEDPIRRYILADEVGLGKTIEAGVILQDRLSGDPNSRVLILAPAPLTRQWLSELHSSFGSARDFKLADLRAEAQDSLHSWNKVICSTELALDRLKATIIKNHWDLVIIDEVHHLLDQPLAYEFVKNLSHITSDLLLLSAIPVRKREGELYKLLALLEPETFTEDKLNERKFLELYELQHAVGRRIRLLRRDIEDYKNDEADKSDLIERLQRITNFEMTGQDELLQKLVHNANEAETDILSICDDVLQHLADNYRLNRRVLRNRRSRLIEEENLEKIERKISLQNLPVTDFELQANLDLLEFLRHLQGETPQKLKPVFLSFSRALLQSAIDSNLCLELLTNLYHAKARDLTEIQTEIVTSVASFNSEQALAYLQLLIEGIRKYVEDTQLNSLISSMKLWTEHNHENERYSMLIDLLRKEQKQGHKTLIFAGFPGLAEKLSTLLINEFGNEKVARFLFSQDDFEKEQNVRDFKDLDTKSFLICDESGGEGRNFQFAHGLVHVDLPYSPSLIEQRIGRLDRLGRDRSMHQVVSHVFARKNCIEEQYIRFLSDGLNSFSSTISGLEFALRNLQDEFLEHLLNENNDASQFLDHVNQTVLNERSRDEGDELLDEASFNPKLANVYSSAGRYNDENLPSLFIEHFKNLTVKPESSVRAISEGIWKFKPDDVPLGALDIQGTAESSEFGIRTGTFSRSIAQNRRDIEFFSYGNPIFDAVLGSLQSKLHGRTYAISCHSNDPVSFAGIEYNLVPKINLPNDLPVYFIARLEAELPYRPDWNYCTLNPHTNFSPREVHAVRKFATKSLSGFRNLHLRQLQSIERLEGASLEDCINYISEVKIPKKEEKIKERVERFINQETDYLIQKNKKLQSISDRTSMKEIEQNHMYIKAINNWVLDFDSIGVLVINK